MPGEQARRFIQAYSQQCNLPTCHLAGLNRSTPRRFCLCSFRLEHFLDEFCILPIGYYNNARLVPAKDVVVQCSLFVQTSWIALF